MFNSQFLQFVIRSCRNARFKSNWMKSALLPTGEMYGCTNDLFSYVSGDFKNVSENGIRNAHCFNLVAKKRVKSNWMTPALAV